MKKYKKIDIDNLQFRNFCCGGSDSFMCYTYDKEKDNKNSAFLQNLQFGINALNNFLGLAVQTRDDYLDKYRNEYDEQENKDDAQEDENAGDNDKDKKITLRRKTAIISGSAVLLVAAGLTIYFITK